jgi:hypothetical protein
MGVKVVVLVPYSGDSEYRVMSWKFVRQWIRRHHPLWDLYEGYAPHAPGKFFSIAKARNTAARNAEDWDVAVFWDSDTIVHPDCVLEAVKGAQHSPRTQWLASDAHIYMDEKSTSRFLDTQMMFPFPRGNRMQSFSKEGIYRRPCSGVFAVHRELWEATGGYVETLGGADSHEDLVFLQCCRIFGDGTQFVEGMQLHLWHPPAARENGRNHRLWQDLSRINTKQQALQALTPYRHRIPFTL